jgi:hypothetical protein
LIVLALAGDSTTTTGMRLNFRQGVRMGRHHEGQVPRLSTGEAANGLRLSKYSPCALGALSTQRQ